MIKYLIILVFFGCTANIYAQKPTLDSNAYQKWQSVKNESISNNGEYVSYVINNEPLNSSTVVLKAIRRGWEMKIPDVNNVKFTSDSQRAIFLAKNDSLYIVKLGGTTETVIPSVSMFTIPTRGRGNVMIYRTRNDPKGLVLYNLSRGNGSNFENVNNFVLSDDEKVLVMQIGTTNNNKHVQSLKYLNLSRGWSKTIWRGVGILQIEMCESTKDVAFTVDETLGRESSRFCFYYKNGNNNAVSLFSDSLIGQLYNGKIRYLSSFSGDGSSLYFNIAEQAGSNKKTDSLPIALPLNVWSYLDEKLQSAQKLEKLGSPLIGDPDFSCVIDVNTRRISRIEHEGEITIGNRHSDLPLVMNLKKGAEMTESRWNRTSKVSVFLDNLKTGKRIGLDKFGGLSGPISPCSKYFIFGNGKDYFSYEIASGNYINITSGIKANWLDYNRSDLIETQRGVAAWLKNDEGVLIYDRFDIWLVDPKGKKKPRNITNGYGSKNNIIFYLALPEYLDRGVDEDASLILNAFNLTTKDNGFYRKNLTRLGDPISLFMGRYIFDIIDNPYSHWSNRPIKARDANGYIVRRMSATESSNIFYTKDFKNFLRLSGVYPEKDYNWYRTELHSWKSLDGRLLQGILYKPENFDSTLKYPVIFNYYEKKTYDLNACLKPDYLSAGAEINIPTYVSNGYLVFTPDIEYEIGNPMQGAVNSVVSAAEYLSKFRFVNPTKMGIQGFSFGGIQTNFVVSHSNIFAAACSGAALSDFVSGYGSVQPMGGSLQAVYEKGGQNRMGAPLWEIPEKYIKNSSIFSVGKVTTPLLMMHTTNDAVCPFSQALEFFTALRRLGRKAWLLEYTDDNHSIRGHSEVDFSIRMKQFFDHYLKDKPAPVWMTRGIPQSKKGIESGLELDNIIRTPGPGLLTKEEQQKVDSLLNRKPWFIEMK